MSMIRVYLYGVDQTVIIPTVGQTDDGMLVELGPVEVFAVSDINNWKRHVLNLLTSGAQMIKGKDQTANPGSAILDRLNLQRWADFERYSVMYLVHLGPKFISIHSTGKNEDGTWTQGKSERTFHTRAPLDIVVSELVMDLLKEPEALKKEPKLLLG